MDTVSFAGVDGEVAAGCCVGGLYAGMAEFDETPDTDMVEPPAVKIARICILSTWREGTEDFFASCRLFFVNGGAANASCINRAITKPFKTCTRMTRIWTDKNGSIVFGLNQKLVFV